MGPKTKELTKTLDALIELLNDVGESHWSSWMQKSNKRILNSDYSGIEHLLGAFGGMGSFNDLVLMKVNGHRIKESQTADLNSKLSELRTSIYTLANEIRRDVER